MTPRVQNMAHFKGSRIGIATVPRQRIEMTEDAVLIQSALLKKPIRPFDRADRVVMIGGTAIIAAVMAAGWFGWLA